MDKVIKIGDLYSNPNNVGGNGRAPVFLDAGIAPVIVGMSGGGNKPHVVRIFDLPKSTEGADREKRRCSSGVIKLGGLCWASGKTHQDMGVYSKEGVSCCLRETDYKNPPKVLTVKKG